MSRDGEAQNCKPQLKVCGTGTELLVRWIDVCPMAYIHLIFINILGNQTKFMEVRMIKAPVLSLVPLPIADLLVPVKAYLGARPGQGGGNKRMGH